MLKKIFIRFGLPLILLILLLALPLAFFYEPGIPVEDLLQDYADETSEWVDVDGLRVHYRDEGPTVTDHADAEEPLLLLHGFASSLHTWDGWTNELRQERRILRLDLPGHGLTGPRSDDAYTTDDYAEFVKLFLDALGIERCVLGGNSMGGAIAVRFTALYPERVSALILIDAAGAPPYEGSPEDPGASGLSKGGSSVMGLIRAPVINRIISHVTPRLIYEEALREVFVDDSYVTHAVVERHFRLTLREGNRKALLKRLTLLGVEPPAAERRRQVESIRQPVLVLWGEGDLWIPLQHGERYHDLLPNSRLVVLPGVGHLPQEEAVEASLEAVRQIL